MGLNRCDFIGHVGRDPETKFSASGTGITRFSLAVSEKRNGETQTTWTDWVCFAKLSDVVAQYVKRGSKLYCSGRYQLQQWEKDGQKHSRPEFILDRMEMLDSRGSQDTRNDGCVSQNAKSEPQDDESFPF